MVAPAAAGQKYLVTFYGSCFGQNILNTFVYHLKTLGTLDTHTVAEDTLHEILIQPNGLMERFINASVPSYILHAIKIQCIYPTRLAPATFPKTELGGYITDTESANLAGVITRRGDLANRSNVGSLHIVAPMGVAGVVNGQVTAEWKTALDLLAEQVEQVYNEIVFNSTWEPVLFNKNAPSVVTKVTDAFPQITARTMRRRTVGLGI